MKHRWPGGKDFAFTVFDDTDWASVDGLSPVYALLRDLGMRTTKSVWPIVGTAPPVAAGGATCADRDYLAWVLQLKKEGFEIGYHNATYHSSTREETRHGLDRFAEIFGSGPRAMANHSICREGIYWGSARLDGINRLIYDALTLGRRRSWYRGHVEGDPLFWGDLCKERIQYVRTFTFDDINTLKACPQMPFHDPARPWVNYWFASSEGGNVQRYNQTLTEKNQDRLEAEGGACIMYTHFASGFSSNGKLEPRFRALMKRLAAKNGWFVPVSTLLDHLLAVQGPRTLADAERTALERRWLLHRVLTGAS